MVEAESHLATIKVALKQGIYVAPKLVPTLRAVAEDWFANKVGMKLRPSTLSCYRVNLNRHILEADFADLRLDKIGVRDITAFRNALATESSRKKGKTLSIKTLSTKTVNYIMRDLEAVFAFAMKARLAAWNPVSSVDRLKAGTDEHDEDGENRRVDVAVTEEEVLSPAQCRKLIEKAPEGFDRAFLMTAVSTGARHDELLALRWTDADLEAGTIHFRRSLSWAKLPG